MLRHPDRLPYRCPVRFPRPCGPSLAGVPAALRDPAHGRGQRRLHERGVVFLPPGLKGDVFTLHGSLAFALVLAAWTYSDVPTTNVLAQDRQRVMAAWMTRSCSGGSCTPRTSSSGR
jgi:hypothetical protein